jgi:hypothetical protein
MHNGLASITGNCSSFATKTIICGSATAINAVALATRLCSTRQCGRCGTCLLPWDLLEVNVLAIM